MGKHIKQRKAQSFQLPLTISKIGLPLLDQQMWCWGCDVRRAGGNLLLEYGFTKRSAPDTRFHSAYDLPLCETCALTVWGWGLWLGHCELGSVFINRTRFQPRYTPLSYLLPNAWQLSELPTLGIPQTPEQRHDAYELLAIAFASIARYEQWIAENVPLSYRCSNLESFPQRKQHKGGIPVEEVACIWQKLHTLIQNERLN
jgi:hypothetical protein